jgi:hypothetical protein
MRFSLSPHFISIFISFIFHGYLTRPLFLGPIYYVYFIVVFMGGVGDITDTYGFPLI